MIENIGRVIQRITDIENRFNPRPPAADQLFAGYLKDEEDKTAPPIRRRADESPASPEAGGIKDLLVQTAQKYGLNSNLVLAVANAESGYRPDAVSSVGAVGVMQLMPDTARSLGVQDSFDPGQNIDGGVRYLKQMLDMFGGNTAHALAAYNAGPNAVKKYGGIPPYNETQAYVKNILSDINNE